MSEEPKKESRRSVNAVRATYARDFPHHVVLPDALSAKLVDAVLWCAKRYNTPRSAGAEEPDIRWKNFGRAFYFMRAEDADEFKWTFLGGRF
jgi:hypothetical protein